MGYWTLMIAFVIVMLFGYWSGRQRTKSLKGKKSKESAVYPLSKSRRQTKLRRIK